MPVDERRMVSSYLNDHLAGAAGGVDLVRRVARAQGDRRPELLRLSLEIAEDRETLARLMAAGGIQQQRTWMLAAWVAEKLGRLKPNGSLVRRTALTDLVELEALRAAVEAKHSGWRVLVIVADRLTWIDKDEATRIEARTRSQAETLDGLRDDAAGQWLTRTSTPAGV